MKKNKLKAGVLGFIAAVLALNFEAKAQVQDYLQVPGPITFHGGTFRLAWSSHPNNTYYKQEYVKAGEKVETFKEMVLLEFLEGNNSPKGMATQKAQELETRKKSDPLVNYEVIESPNGDEFILDFIMSGGPPEDPEVVEWNAYRYKLVTDGSGKKGVLLLGISRRAYAEASTAFLQELKTLRPAYRNELSVYKIPKINTGKK